MKLKRATILKALLIAICGFWAGGCQTDLPPSVPATLAPEPTTPTMEANSDCQVEAVQGFLTTTETLLQQFDILAIKAEDSSPEALLPVIQEMEALTSSFEAETPPPCALQAQAALSEYFMRQIQGYLRLHAAALGVTPRSDRSALDEFQAANDKLARFNKLAHDLAVSAGLK